MSLARSLTESEKKIVGARQQWHCSACKIVLPAAYQVDHTVPLCDGGDDNIANCTAMCPNCHAAKTQLESIARSKKSICNADRYANRVDVCLSATEVRCSLCYSKRSIFTDHGICPAIEMPNLKQSLAKLRLAQFAFMPRNLQTSKT